MYIYGHDGYIYQKTGQQMETVIKDVHTPLFDAPKLQPPFDDTFRLFKAVVRGEVTLDPYDPNSLENNVMVVRILEAAKESSRLGRPVKF